MKTFARLSNYVKLLGLFILGLVLLLSSSRSIYGQTLKSAPLNPDFIKYINGLNQMQLKSNDLHGLGYIPPPILPNFGPTSARMLTATTFAPVYDLRTSGTGGTSLLTSVKNQGSCGCCWAFATMGAIEAYVKLSGKGEYDLSENNLKECHGYVWAPCAGGNSSMSAAYLTRKSGPVSELNDPYSVNVVGCKSNITPEFSVSNIRSFPNNSSVIKQAILDYGALYTTFYYQDASYNAVNYTYYYNGPTVTNHAVVLVGWDDTKVTAGGTGAWIIKNSWGAAWGESGFFYISYNDSRINSEVTAFPGIYNNVANSIQFSYDNLGYEGSLGYGSTIGYGLIRFSTSNTNYTLNKLSTYIPSGPATLTFEVYGAFDGTTLSGLMGSITNASCDLPGYYTFDLATPIPLSANSDFYIKVTYNTAGYNYPIPLESAISGYSNPVIESGRCWVSGNGTNWQAIGSGQSYSADLCINAYAVLTCTAPAPIIGTIIQPTCTLATGSVVLNSLPSTGTWSLNVKPGGTTTTGTGTSTTIAGLAAGTYTFTVANSSSCTSASSANVVINAQPQAPTITGTLAVCAGSTTQLNGSGTAATTTPWVSATTTVATVSGTGLVTGVAAGTSVITFKNIDGCTKTATVTVSASPNISGTFSVCAGSTSQLTGSGTAATTSPWASGTTAVATVGSTGLVTGVAAGTSVITFTNSGGCKTTATVIVSAVPTITGTLTVCAGSTTQLAGSGTPASSTPWVSGTKTVATISSTGLVTGVAAGTSVITYKNSGGCTKTATVTVSAIPTITGTLTVCAGLTTQLTGSGTAATTTPWVSANTTVATISSTGLVKGVVAGTSVITFKNSGGCTKTTTVTVYALPSAPAAIGGTKSVCVGSTTTLTDATTGGVWSSSTTTLATVSTSGVVKGVASGTATIVYTVTNANGCKNSVSASVTVAALPAQPGNFTKSTSAVTPGQSNVVYTVPLVSGVTYKWSYSGTGATITGTTNSVSISYSATATSGTLSVTATNTSGCTSVARTLAITGLKGIMIPDNSLQGSVDTTATFNLPKIQNELNVYPNPTFGSATFTFQINENARVRLDIYSVNGLLIARVFDGDAEAGIAQSVKFNQSLSTGIYPCILRWNGKMITVKLVIVQ